MLLFMPLKFWAAEHEHMQCPESDDVEKTKNEIAGNWLCET